MRLDDLYLVDIIETWEAIEKFMDGVREEVFIANEVLCAAVEFKLMVMGEALSSMTQTTRDAFTRTPVDRVRGMRNRIVHGYFDIDKKLVYQIAIKHVPPLAAEAEQLLASLFPDTHERLQERRRLGIKD